MVAATDPAIAAEVTIQVLDTDGNPARDAVVRLLPRDGRPQPVGDRPDERVIDQRNEEFVPLVTLLRQGGRVIFRNSDRVRHHVYSFAPIKQFEMVLSPAERAAAVQFDRPGLAAVGCNIHDHMIAYVYVTDTRWAALTGADGRAKIADVPPGPYATSVWHPRLRPGIKEPTGSVEVGAAQAGVSLKIPLLPPAPPAAARERRYD